MGLACNCSLGVSADRAGACSGGVVLLSGCERWGAAEAAEAELTLHPTRTRTRTSPVSHCRHGRAPKTVVLRSGDGNCKSESAPLVNANEHRLHRTVTVTVTVSLSLSLSLCHCHCHCHCVTVTVTVTVTVALGIPLAIASRRWLWPLQLIGWQPLQAQLQCVDQCCSSERILFVPRAPSASSLESPMSPLVPCVAYQLLRGRVCTCSARVCVRSLHRGSTCYSCCWVERR